MAAVSAPGRLLAIAVVLFVLGALNTHAAEDGDLAGLDIEELMEVEVVTAARRAMPLTQVAGAVTVLDEEDIFHSGATTLPEALKLVPGVHVANVDLDKWAVGIRGFNGLLSNKHLVLIDGRPVTSPTTGFVDWGSQVPLSVVKRIEVVRGIWTHLWGADSFTGVINVITKPAAETQAAQSVTTVGSSGIEQLLRYGGEFGESGHYRAYMGGSYKDGNWHADRADRRSSSDWKKWQLGTRVDWQNAYTDCLSLQADFVASSIRDGASGFKHIFAPRVRDTLMGYAQFNWNRALGLDAGINFRTSYTRDQVSVGDMTGGTNTLDVEVQYAAEQYSRHRLTWGLGGRYYWDDINSGHKTKIDREQRYTLTSNGFVQDRVTLVDDRLYMTLGAKLDHFGEGSFEIQPTIRLLHTLEDQEYWFAVSRAVRADTRWQRSGSYSVQKRGTVYTVKPSDSLTTEKLISYEAGHRRRITKDLLWDVSLYVNEYDELVMLAYDEATTTATLSNSLKGTAYGVETSLEWVADDWLTLTPSASVIYQNIKGFEESFLDDAMPDEGVGYQLKLQTRLKSSKNTGLDFLTGYLDDMPGERTPGYFSLETHAYWHASESLTFELIGRNLGEAKEQYSSLHVGPSVDLRITWDF